MLPAGTLYSSRTKIDCLEHCGREHFGSANSSSNSSGNQGTSASAPPSTNKKRSPGGMKYYPGLRLEAKDLGSDKWYAVKVVEVDLEDEEILIHFEKWSQRYDEWIPIDSSRLRPVQEPLGGFTKKSIKVFEVGDNVMATWSDCRKYPAKVKTVLGNDSYEVLFYDGFTKNIKGGRMSQLSDLQLTKIEQLKPGIGPSNDNSHQSFAPKQSPGGVLETTLGSKEERRERKRKLNVAELFHFRKRRRDVNPSGSASVNEIKITESLLSSSRGTKKQSFSEKVSSGSENKTSKIAVCKGNISDVTEDFFGGEMMGESNFQLNVGNCADKNKKRSNYGDKKDSKVMFGKNVRRRLNKFGGRKSYSVSASVKDIAEGFHNSGEGNGALESVMKPPEEWVPKGEPAYVVDGTGGPRKSIVVDDPRVPAGWSRHFIQRMSGHSAGKWDVFFVCPLGRKFRTRQELRLFYEDHGEVFPSEQFDFSLGRRKNKTHNSELDLVATTQGLGSSKTSQHAGSSHHHLLAPTLKGSSTASPVRRVKTLLPRVRASDSTSVMPSLDSDVLDGQSNVSDNSVMFRDLKIEMENDAFKCPKEGCCKNFRKESLLQMHLKHYHPEYNRFVASTPNVADLAYARTIGEPLEELHPKAARPSLTQKVSRLETVRHTHVTSGGVASSSPTSSHSTSHQRSVLYAPLSVTSDSPAGHTNPAEYHATPSSVRTLDSSYGGLANDLVSISHKASHSHNGVNKDVPKKTVRTLMPVTRVSVSETCNADGTDEMVNVIDITPSPNLSISMSEQHLERAGMKGMKLSQSPSLMLPYVSMVQTKSSRMVRRIHMTDFHMEPVMKKRKPVEIEECSQTSGAVSTNRQTRGETPRREELVNCTCGYQEEDGLMIQCDLCLCWQHGLCNNIEHEDEVPEKYTCVLCRHPSRERPSKHFLHDQDWLKEGRLLTHSFRSKSDADINQRNAILKHSHDLIGTILQLQKVIHSLRVKVNIAERADHPKLYLWNQSWEKDSLYQTPPCSITVPTGSGLGSQLPEVGDLKEGKHCKVSNLNLNQLDKSCRPSHMQPPVGSSIDHDVDGDLAEFQSTDLEGETSDICPVRDNTHLMADDWDTKDTNFSQDSMSSGSGENVPSDLHETRADTKDDIPYLSNKSILSNTINVESETEVTSIADASEQETMESTVKETEKVELKEQESKDLPTDMVECLVDNPDASCNSDTQDKDELTNRGIGSVEDNDLQLPFCQKDLMHLATSMADKLASFNVPNENRSNFITQQRVPQPETPIVPQECQNNLLHHVEAFHQQLELRLTSLETQIAGLESMDPYLAHDESTDQDTRETVQMLIQDLSLLRNAASLN